MAKRKKVKPKKQPAVKTQKMSLLQQRKNISDKFFDLLQHETKVAPVLKNGKVKIKKNGAEDWRRKGVKKFADKLGVTVGRINSIIRSGSVKDTGDYLITGVEKLHTKLKLPKTKKTTKEFTVHNFTFDNFFKRKPFGKIKANEQLLFRAGLYLEFAKKDKDGDFTDKTGYTIQNLPITHYSNLYPEGYEEFFEIIKEKLQSHPSLKLFRFNYFDVRKIKVDTIEERVKAFQDKQKPKKRKKKK